MGLGPAGQHGEGDGIVGGTGTESCCHGKSWKGWKVDGQGQDPEGLIRPLMADL